MKKQEREKIVALDKRYVWHPYTAMQEYRDSDPLVIERAQGAQLFDFDGKVYLDGNSSWWVSTLGHAHPRLIAALKKQADELCHVSLAGVTHRNAAELGEALCKIAPPGLSHVFYTDDGSTAVEMALKASLQYWAQNGRPARKEFLALEGAFHGETLGVTALGGIAAFHDVFAASAVHCTRLTSPCVALAKSLEELEAHLRRRHERIAALVVEPLVQGAAGMRIYAAEFLRAARTLCERYDVFLICDEVFTGYGRTGKQWACDHENVSPDFLCTAKGFTGGVLPMAATLVSERVYEGFLGTKERAFHYGHSFCGNPLGAALAREVLRIFDEEAILEHAAPKVRRIAEFFESMQDVDGVLNPRALGMIGALDLEGSATGYLAHAGWEVYAEARRRGAYLRPLGNVVYVTPPLTISDTDLSRLLEILRESVEQVTARARRKA